MSDYVCPACNGGFPEAELVDDACPWCELELGEAAAYRGGVELGSQHQSP